MAILIALTNLFILSKGEPFVLGANSEVKSDYIIVLGAGVHGAQLSGALRTRMEMAIQLIQKERAHSILLSGDGTDVYYNETRAMQRFALSKGVPAGRIFLDPRGYSTYDSIVQAKTIFEVERALFVSQEFHLPRVLWLARSLGIDAFGIATDSIEDETFYQMREIPARTKDFLLHFLDYVPHGRREAPLR
jgi:SanA protein